MEIAQIVAVGIIAAVLAVTVKQHSPQIGLIIGIAASVLIFLMILPRFSAAVGILQNIANNTGIDLSYVGLVLKIIGIAYIAELGSQLCADAGETAIASKIELAGKVLIILVSAPIMLSLVEVVSGGF